MRALSRTVVFLLCFFLVNCSSDRKNNPTTGDKTIKIEHKLGTTEVPLHPERIVALDMGAVETLLELGIKPAGIPKDVMPDYLSYLKKDTSIGNVGVVKEPSLEKVNAMKPDLILISTRQVRFYDELSAIAPTIFVGVDEKEYIRSFRENTEILAEITGKEALAQKKLDTLDKKIEATQALFEKDTNRALFLLYNNGKFSFYGSGSRFGFIYDVAGIRPAIQEDKTSSVFGRRISNELIAEVNPDYIFIVDRNAAVLGKATRRKEIENKLIQQTTAYKKDNIFFLNPNIWFISGGGITSMNMMLDDLQHIFDSKTS